MDRIASRFAVRALAWATVPMLMIVGCSSGPGDESPGEPSAANAPSPKAVKFAGLPDPCTTISADTIKTVVPETDDKAGKALNTSDTAGSGTCLWSGLDGYQFRSLTVSLKRFDSDSTLGDGDERAGDYLRQQVAEITGDKANTDIKEADLDKVGDEAVSIGYAIVKKPDDDDKQEYRQQRVAARTGNVVVTVDYAGAGFEDGKTPGAKDIRKSAELSVQEAVTALNDFAESEGGEKDSEDSGKEEEDADEKDKESDA